MHMYIALYIFIYVLYIAVSLSGQLLITGSPLHVSYAAAGECSIVGCSGEAFAEAI